MMLDTFSRAYRKSADLLGCGSDDADELYHETESLLPFNTIRSVIARLIHLRTHRLHDHLF